MYMYTILPPAFYNIDCSHFMEVCIPSPSNPRLSWLVFASFVTLLDFCIHFCFGKYVESVYMTLRNSVVVVGALRWGNGCVYFE